MKTIRKTILYGERLWAVLRLWLLFALNMGLAGGMAAAFERFSFYRFLHNIVFPSSLLFVVLVFWIYYLRYRLEEEESVLGAFWHWISLILGLVAAALLDVIFVLPRLTPGASVVHYLLPPWAAIIGAVLAGARYIQDIYNVDRYSVALLYLITSLFGIAYPELTVDEDRPKIGFGKVNRLDSLGGPGYITISPSNAVLIHEPPDLARVYSGNTFYIPRFAKIIEVVNLEDRRETIDEVVAITRDGIKITVRKVELRFRIWSDLKTAHEIPVKRSHLDPYPYTPQAVRDSIFNLSVNDKGTTSWMESVKIAVKGKIGDYISSHRIDEIVTPDYKEADPRRQIHDQLFTPEMENRLKDLGARLLWCDIGHFEEDRAALGQRLETWSAKWIGSANVIRAEGDAQRIAYQELGRAEAQADMLTSIIHAFGDVDLSSENKDQNIRKVILMRTAQVLESLIDNQGSTQPGKDSSSGTSDNGNRTKENGQ